MRTKENSLARMQQKNYSIEIVKFIASIFVIFIHVNFPGDFGKIVNCLARFGVPFFFAISGYYSYQIDGNRLIKRIKRIFKLNIWASLLYILYHGITNSDGIFAYFIQKATVKNLARGLFFNINPFSGHLWYLSAILYCYILLWIYTTFYKDKDINYIVLYIMGFTVFMFQIIFGIYALGVGFEVSYRIYRNFLFFGLPMFTLGIFIRQYQEQIIKNFALTTRKEVVLIITGILLSLVQWFGIGKVELPIGTIFETVALLLLLITNPQIPNLTVWKAKLIESLGNISMIVYIIHQLYNYMMKYFSTQNEFVFYIYQNKYLYPIVVAVLSILSGIIYNIVSIKWKSLKSKKKIEKVSY